MKNRIIILIISTIAFTACHEPRKLAPAPETIFDDHGMHVITSFYNERTRIISVLYGNDDALAHAGGEQAAHMPGEVFKLVTWDLKSNPLWFGSDINGGLKTIETVTVQPGASGPAINYTIENRGPANGKSAPSDNAERISFIFAQRASVFP